VHLGIRWVADPSGHHDPDIGLRLKQAALHVQQLSTHRLTRRKEQAKKERSILASLKNLPPYYRIVMVDGASGVASERV
jgi:hypothetical protein